eukprot:Gb_19881 [translate_table: standard]
MDPLSVLRDYTIRGDLDRITRQGGDFRFGDDYRFPCNIETAYRAKQGGLYTLESLVFFIKNARLKHTEYLQQARTQKLQIITYTDRKPLIDYLEGKVNSTDAIELVVPRDSNLKHWDAEDVEDYRPDEPGIGAGLFNDNSKRNRPEENGGQENEYKIKKHPEINYMEVIRAIEKPLKDRENLLEVRNKNFQNILSMSTKKDEERRRVEEMQQRKDVVSETPLRSSKNHFPSTEKKGFWKDTEELGIDTTQSYIGERAKQKDVGKIKQVGNPRTSQALNALNASIKGNINKTGEGVPIIVVPSAFQTLLNMYNAKEFLEDGAYVAPDVKVKQMPKKPECITIQRKSSHGKSAVTFEVRDKPSSFAPEDWDRVVAVFVLGKEWQFKNWPFKDHVEIFNKLLGFYIRFEDDSVESAKVVKQWNVKIISISKHKRHQDKAATLEFWTVLDDHMRSRKSNMTF